MNLFFFCSIVFSIELMGIATARRSALAVSNHTRTQLERNRLRDGEKCMRQQKRGSPQLCGRASVVTARDSLCVAPPVVKGSNCAACPLGRRNAYSAKRSHREVRFRWSVPHYFRFLSDSSSLHARADIKTFCVKSVSNNMLREEQNDKQS
jgi:hypothetical protein